MINCCSADLIEKIFREWRWLVNSSRRRNLQIVMLRYLGTLPYPCTVWFVEMRIMISTRRKETCVWGRGMGICRYIWLSIGVSGSLFLTRLLKRKFKKCRGWEMISLWRENILLRISLLVTWLSRWLSVQDYQMFSKQIRILTAASAYRCLRCRMWIIKLQYKKQEILGDSVTFCHGCQPTNVLNWFGILRVHVIVIATAVTCIHSHFAVQEFLTCESLYAHNRYSDVIVYSVSSEVFLPRCRLSKRKQQHVRHVLNIQTWKPN